MIGVLLAFLVSRIISESSDYDRLEYDGQALIDESADLKARIQSMNFDWHDARIYEEHDFDGVRADLISLNNTSDEVKIDFLKRELPKIYYPEKFIRRLNIKDQCCHKGQPAISKTIFDRIRDKRLSNPCKYA